MNDQIQIKLATEIANKSLVCARLETELEEKEARILELEKLLDEVTQDVGQGGKS